MSTWTVLAVTSRQLAAGACFVCSVQFGARAISRSVEELAPQQSVSHPLEEAPRPIEPQQLGPDRPDLEKLQEIMEQNRRVKTNSMGENDEETVPQPRRLLVDLGPPRSRVYVNGVLVGRTPFVGQVSCLDGDTVRVQVLPPTGAPKSREVLCRTEVVARETESAPAGESLPEEGQGSQALESAAAKLPSLQE